MPYGAAHVTWATASELNSAGYYLYAETKVGGVSILTFVPAANPGSGQGAVYNYIHYMGPVGGFDIAYHLVAVGLSGDTQDLGTVAIYVPAAPSRD